MDTVLESEIRSQPAIVERLLERGAERIAAIVAYRRRYIRVIVLNKDEDRISGRDIGAERHRQAAISACIAGCRV